MAAAAVEPAAVASRQTDKVMVEENDDGWRAVVHPLCNTSVLGGPASPSIREVRVLLESSACVPALSRLARSRPSGPPSVLQARRLRGLSAARGGVEAVDVRKMGARVVSEEESRVWCT